MLARKRTYVRIFSNVRSAIMPDPKLTVHGHTFWRAERGGQSAELTTTTGIELDAARCRWTIGAPGGEEPGDPVESASRDVRWFMTGVLSAMQRATRRATVRPAPKPRTRPARSLPGTTQVPCPLCAGEAWPDCEICDGAGVVTPQRAAAWREAYPG
jgi:hypothetical protein